MLRDAYRLIGVANFIAGQGFNTGEHTVAELKQTLSANKKRVDQLVTSTLLPFQISELKKVAFLDVASKFSLPKLIEKDSICKFLGLTDAEKRRLAKSAKRIQKQLEEDIAELKRKARKELLSELPESKRALLGFDLD